MYLENALDEALDKYGPPTNVIAVGTAIAGRPPHRSVREELPHTALAASRSRNRTLGYGCRMRGLGR